MNPCPCGYHGDPSARCHCSAEQVRRYRGRISGPLLDRIDLRIHVGHPDVPLLGRDVPRGEGSKAVRARVTAAHAVQMARAGRRNADLDASTLERHCSLDDTDIAFVEAAATRLGFSPRAQHRVLKVARTIADLAEAPHIERGHLAEALALRRLEAAAHRATGEARAAAP
jgi:magnesium chelatase family protein